MKKVISYLTGYHSFPVIADLSKPMGVKTVNPEYLNIPRKEEYIKEITETKKLLEGVLTHADVIKDTFNRPLTLKRFVD